MTVGPTTSRDASVAAGGNRRRTSAHLPGARAARERTTIAMVGNTIRWLAVSMVRMARVRAVGLDDVLRQKAEGRRIVLVSWHGYDLCNLVVYRPLFGRDSRAVIMAPCSWEGRVMEQFATGLGYDVVPVAADDDSSLSARGVVEMVSKIKDGCDGMLAVDGPSGPAEQAKLGAAVIAKRAAAIIVPTVVAGSRELRIHSRWDKHLLIQPFARMIVHFGPLIDTAPTEGPAPTTEEIRTRMEVALHTSAQRARVLARDLGAND